MRYRWMYHMTGLPGWMRFGFSPGWAGWSPTGLGPAAQYFMTGQWPTPQMAAAWQAGRVPWRPGFPILGAMTPEQEIQVLKNQAEVLKAHLETIANRIDELEKQSES
ncbi:MAG TPA: hypothetical protein EYP04_08765 [Anaerolineae bacterium]|nr:hypothetical protein [Anaerolineae bacterium]